MRLWSLHPSQLDAKGLVACWREALLAQAVIAGRTVGYTRHPQLERFTARPDPLRAIAAYLHDVAREADARGYRFDAGRIGTEQDRTPIPVTDGQIALEWEHLGAKLAARSPADWERWRTSAPAVHPLFVLVPGPAEPWEKAVPPGDLRHRTPSA